MRSISTVLLASAVLGAATVMAGLSTNEGCSSSTSGMIFNATYQYNSAGKCGGACSALNYVAFATQNQECYCGSMFPPTADVITNSTCSFTCPGYPDDSCGGSSAYSLYTTGLSTDVQWDDQSSASTTTSAVAKATSASTTTAKPSVVTVGGETVVVTATPQTGTASASASSSASSSSSSSSSGPSKAGIAAGVVVGFIAIAAIAGGLFLFFRSKQRREIEEEHKRQAAVSSFMDGKPPASSGAGSLPDTRLDPAYFAQRRLSDGSIADNQDYSRRILKVTNA